MPRPRFDIAAAPPADRAAPRIRQRAGAGIPRAGRNRLAPDVEVAVPAVIPAARDPSPVAQRAPTPPLPARQSPPRQAQPVPSPSPVRRAPSPMDQSLSPLGHVISPQPSTSNDPTVLQRRRMSTRTNAGQHPRYSQDGDTPATLTRRRRSSPSPSRISRRPRVEPQIPTNPVINPCGRCKKESRSMTLVPCAHTVCFPCSRQLFFDGKCCYCQKDILQLFSFNLSDS